MAREMKETNITYLPFVPYGWNIGRVKNAFVRKNERAEQDEPVVLSLARSGVKVRDLSNNDGQIAESYYNYNPVEPQDLLLNPMDLVSGANCSLSEVEGVISPAYINLKARKNICPKYFDFFFKLQYWSMSFFAHGKGVSFDNRWTLSADTILNYHIPFPSFEEQKRIADFLDNECAKIDSTIEKTQKTIEEYKALKHSIITEAVTKGIRGARPMKDSGIEWIGNIPATWNILSLGTVTKAMRNGYVGPTRDLFVDDGIRYIQSLHIKDGRIFFSNHEYYVSEEWANVHPKIKENDVLIVQTGDIGSVGLVTKEYDSCNCHALIIATPNTKLVFPKYLTFFLRSRVGKELLLYHKTGALLPHLNSGKIKYTSICVPDLEEQNEIACYLDDKCSMIDEVVSKKERLVEELEIYKKSLIYECVTGKKEIM